MPFKCGTLIEVPAGAGGGTCKPTPATTIAGATKQHNLKNIFVRDSGDHKKNGSFSIFLTSFPRKPLHTGHAKRSYRRAIETTASEHTTNRQTAGCEHRHTGNMRCALLFFGLVKTFNTTVLPSIKEHILQHNPTCTVFAHTYDIHETSTLRNGEHHAPIYPRDVYGLTRNVVMDTLGTYAKRLAPHDFALGPPRYTLRASWGPEQVGNMKKQWTSIERVWDLMEQDSAHYDRVGLFRLDVEYTMPINISRGDAVVPMFSAAEQGRANDRMFYGLHRYAKVWATERFNNLDLWATNRGDSEEYVHRLLSLHKVPYVKDACICFRRVRANGVMNQYFAAPCDEIAKECAKANGATGATQQKTKQTKKIKRYALYAYSFGNFRNEMDNPAFIASLQKLGRMGIDCFFYTDKPYNLYSRLQDWAIVRTSVSTSVNGIPGTRATAKRLKWDPPKELHRYSYLIHVDSSCHSLQTALELLRHPFGRKNLDGSALAEVVDANRDVSLFIRKSSMRATMEEEVRAVMDAPKLNPPTDIRAWDHYLKAANLYHKINAIPLPHTNFFVRNMSDERIVQAGKDLLKVEMAHGLWSDQTVYGYTMTLKEHADINVMNMDAQWGGYDKYFHPRWCRNEKPKRKPKRVAAHYAFGFLGCMLVACVVSNPRGMVMQNIRAVLPSRLKKMLRVV